MAPKIKAAQKSITFQAADVDKEWLDEMALRLGKTRIVAGAERANTSAMIIMCIQVVKANPKILTDWLTLKANSIGKKE